MSTLKSLTIVAVLLAGGTSLAMAQNGLPTGGKPPVAGTHHRSTYMFVPLRHHRQKIAPANNATVEIHKLHETIDMKALPHHQLPDEVYR